MAIRETLAAKRRRALREGILPDLNGIPKKMLPMVASATTLRLGHIFTRWIDRTAEAEWGITGSRLMLVVMLTRQGDMAMGEAADILDVTPRAITRLVDGLEADGFVTRKTSKDDKRSSMLGVTGKAKSLVKANMPKHEARMQELFGIFTDEELKTMVEFHHRIQFKLRSFEVGSADD
jgi:DNA-binding MarR family transcriptional regulator